MTQTYSIAGMTCQGCAATVKKALSAIPGIEEVNVDLEKGKANISMQHHVPAADLKTALEKYPSYKLGEENEISIQRPANFWNDKPVWQRASLNTLNCLIGCSIGDFGMIVFLQKVYPDTSMTVQMILATLAGLATSILLETTLLRMRERFAWSAALQTAFSMSFLSMVAMELVMNATDFMITGGKAAFGNPMYWMALVIAMTAGFFAPLPYNYYRLKKYNLACH